MKKEYFFLFVVLFLVGCQVNISSTKMIELIENNKTENLNWWACFPGEKKVLGVVEENLITKSYVLKDFCKSEVNGNQSNELVVFSCKKGIPQMKKSFCISGCQDASCNAFSSCNDSDGGKNYLVPGKLTIIDKFGKENILEDVCLGRKLTELSCASNKEVNVEEVTCPWSCVQGKCSAEKGLVLDKTDLKIPKKINLEVVPLVGFTNTKFQVNFLVEGTEISEPQVIYGSRGFQLYDDGFHADRLARDNFFATTLQFSNPGRYDLGVEYLEKGIKIKKNNLTSVWVTKPIQNKCQLFKKAKSDKKITLVFAMMGYKNTSEVLGKIIDFSEIESGLFSMEPFKSNKDLFEIKYVGAELLNNEELLFSNTLKKGFQLLATCPGSSNIVVHKDSSVIMNGESGRAKNNFGHSYYGPIKSESPVVVLHELLHTFGGLIDEYETDMVGESFHPEQCFFSSEVICQEDPVGEKYSCQETDKSYADCLANSSWKKMIGNGCGVKGIIDCKPTDKNYQSEVNCYLGCGRKKNLYRSTFSSGMRKISSPLVLGPVNEKLVCQKIEDLTGYRKGKCLEYE